MDVLRRSNHRVDWIDTLKLIGIFYIYVGHFGKNAGLLYPFVFSFHVPLFFFISGIFAKKPDNLKSLPNIFLKSFKLIIVPYFIFCVLSLAFYLVRFNWDAATLYRSAIGAIFGVRGGIFAESLWFLPCMFIVIIYHSIMMCIIKNKWLVMSLSFLIYLWLMPKAIISHPKLFFNLDSAACYLSYYSLGYCLASPLKFNSIYERSFQFRLASALITAISTSLFIYVYFHGFDSLIKWISITHVRVASAFVLTCLMFIPSLALAYILNSSLLSDMGKSTIVYCGTEQIIKLTFFSLVSLLGLKINYSSPIQPVIISVICLYVSHKTISRAYNYYINKIN